MKKDIVAFNEHMGDKFYLDLIRGVYVGGDGETSNHDAFRGWVGEVTISCHNQFHVYYDDLQMA